MVDKKRGRIYGDEDNQKPNTPQSDATPVILPTFPVESSGEHDELIGYLFFGIDEDFDEFSEMW